MKALFVELPAFARHRADYLDDDEYRRLQETLLANPECGDLLQGAGGLRKMRFGDARRRKGTRGGLRIVYYWWSGGGQFWLFTLFDKDEMKDLTRRQQSLLKEAIQAELDARRTT